jgi:hypothetical protein
MAIASFAAGENITAGQVVYVNEVGRLFLASSADLTTASVVGIAIDTGSSNTLIRVNVDSLFYGYTGLIPGDRQFLSITNSGQLVSYSGWQQELDVYSDNAYLQYVGRAISTSGVEVELSTPIFMSYPIS